MAATYSSGGVENTISARVEMLTNGLDQIVKREALTNGLNASKEIQDAFGRAKSAKIPTIAMDGLGNYDKVKGYPVGATTVTWEEYTLAYDRGLEIDIDRLDVLQTDGIMTAAAVGAQLMRQHVIPEIDATRLSGMVAKTKAADATHVVEETAAPTAANLLTKIGAGLDMIYEERGVDSGATIFMNNNLKGILRSSTEYTKVRNVSGTPSIDLTTESIEGNSIVWVPSARMKTAYTYGTPGSTTSDKGGFSPASSAQNINFVIVAPGSAQGVTVFSKPKYYSADEYQDKDSEVLKYRIFHDIIVEKNSGASGIYAHTGKAS